MIRTRTTNDILSHVPGTFKRVASTHGGEWAGPCPWCHGTDRFRIWPYREASEIVYWCRGCGASGDLIQFLRDAKGFSFVEACQVSGQVPKGKGKGRVLDLLKNRRRSSALEPEQLTTLETIQIIHPRMCQALLRPRAQAYLAGRRIPLEVAQAEGMGYLPPLTEESRAAYDRHRVLRFWEDSLVTPTPSPAGMSYTGRTLRLWEPGMDEEAHKGLLKQQGLPRLLKTGNAGWLWRPDEVGRAVVMVEGVFEKLALLAAGFASREVIAAGSNAANVDWLPPGVRTVLVAFNGDERGRVGARRLVAELRLAGFHVEDCPLPEDGQGTDWSARWRIGGREALRFLFDSWDRAISGLPATSPASPILCAMCGKYSATRRDEKRGRAYCDLCWDYRDLDAKVPVAEAWERCCQCGEDVEHYDEDGVAYCGEHWRARSEQEVPATVSQDQACSA